MSWYLVARSGPETGAGFQLAGDTITVGRASDNNIVIDDEMVSRYHARLDLQARAYFLADLDSANGTWLNERRLETPARMHLGDCIRFGTRSAFVCSTIPYLVDDPAPETPCNQPAATRRCLPSSALLWVVGALAALVLAAVAGAVFFLF